MKKAKPLIILCAVLVLLVVSLFVIKGVQKANEQKAQQQAQEDIIYIGQIENASEISFTDANGQQLTFVLDDSEQWRYKSDENFPVNQTYITRIAQLINGCTATRAFEDADLTEYGLDQPQNTITAQDGDGNSLKLDISQAGADVCYATDGSGTVYVVDSNFISYTDYEFLDFAQVDTFTQAQEDEISTVVVSGGGKSLTLTAKSGTYSQDEISWYVTQDQQQVKTDDITLEGDSSATALAKNAVNVFSSYRYTSVVDYNPDQTDNTSYGLDDPILVTVTYTVSDTDTGTDAEADTEIDTQQEEFTLIIGSQTQDGLWYFTVPDSQLVYTISDSFISPIVTALEQLGQ